MLTKRILFTVVICLLVAPFVAKPGRAQGQEVCGIPAFYNGEIEFNQSECSHMEIGMFYFAFSPGLVKEAIKATTFDLTFTGPGGTILDLDPEDAEAYWEPIEAIPAEWFGLICPHHDVIYWGWWRINLGLIDQGTYHLANQMTIEHPLTDALQACTNLDGTPVPRWMDGPWDALFETTIIINP